MRLSGIRTDISQEFRCKVTQEKQKGERKSEQKMRELGLSTSVCPGLLSWFPKGVGALFPGIFSS